MDKTLYDKYMAEMMNMYKASKTVPTVSNIVAENPDSSGGLIAIVTALRRLYPVQNAKVTVFTGDYSNMQVIATALTDNSGRTRTFTLETPERQLSLQAGENKTPYASYNMLVEAEGYLDNIHLNIPVFSGVTSLQSSDMVLLETAGIDKGARVFDESQKYNL